MNPILRIALAAALAMPAATARADALTADKKQALTEFIDAYGIRAMWPQLTPKIARDSLPRLQEAALADIEADALPAAGKAAARVRLDALMPAARRDLESALQGFDADELAVYTAFSIYARYFETAEIRQMTAFFASPTGRKMVALSPTLLAEARQPGATDVMARHFAAPELDEIAAFARSPIGLKMDRTTKFVRDETHDYFISRSAPAVQSLARRLATMAESPDPGSGAAPLPSR